MAKIFITGSSDGLGLLAAKSLIEAGHEVVLHARNQQRAGEVTAKLPGHKVLTGDLSDINQTKSLAAEANTFGTFDAVIHNAGVYQAAAEQLLNVNVLAPYILTVLMNRPKRLTYLSSSMHLSGQPKLTKNPSYSDTKLQILMLAKSFARLWPDVYSNAMDPGWVPTKMGGTGAPDDLEKGYETQTWLAVSNDPEALVRGQYFYHKKPGNYSAITDDINAQKELLRRCAELTGVQLNP